MTLAGERELIAPSTCVHDLSAAAAATAAYLLRAAAIANFVVKLATKMKLDQFAREQISRSSRLIQINQPVSFVVVVAFGRLKWSRPLAGSSKWPLAWPAGCF